jgi:sensor histidine kinase YesM
MVCIFIGSLAYARHYLTEPPPGTLGLAFEFSIWLTCFLPWIGFSRVVFRVENKYPVAGPNRRLNATRLVGLGLALSYAGAQAALLLSLLFQLLFQQPLTFPKSWLLPPIGEMLIQGLNYGAVLVAAYVIREHTRMRDREQQAAVLALQKAQLETSLRRAELEALRARLNPHFLFNSLQNIAVLTGEDPSTASRMLTKLGDVLRAALRQGADPETTLESEIALTKAYVAVEQMRFGDRLSVLFDISEDTREALVPTFLLQPLVENAIRHGLCDVQRPGAIAICSAVTDGNLSITVTDNGVGLRIEDAGRLLTGVGLTVTCERLEKLYPRQHSFSLSALPEGGTQATVVLPLRKQPSAPRVMANEQTALANC